MMCQREIPLLSILDRRTGFLLNFEQEALESLGRF